MNAIPQYIMETYNNNIETCNMKNTDTLKPHMRILCFFHNYILYPCYTTITDTFHKEQSALIKKFLDESWKGRST